MLQLFDTLENTTSHYVRCLAPNSQASASLFDTEKVCRAAKWKYTTSLFTLSLPTTQVLAQLRASGVLASIQISAAGLPCRLSYEEFAQRYKNLLRPTERELGTRAVTTACVHNFCDNAGGIQFGHTKVFMKDWQLSLLEQCRSRHDQAVRRVQSTWRSRVVRRAFLQQRAAATRLAQWWKLHLCQQAAAKKRLAKTKAAAVAADVALGEQMTIKPRAIDSVATVRMATAVSTGNIDGVHLALGTAVIFRPCQVGGSVVSRHALTAVSTWSSAPPRFINRLLIIRPGRCMCGHHHYLLRECDRFNCKLDWRAFAPHFDE